MKGIYNIIICVLFSFIIKANAQEITLFEQLNGRYDYIAIGNTLNPSENNVSSFCTILESSDANLTLPVNATIIKAYLYWAGSGDGDTTVSLNGTTINAEDTYIVNFGALSYFSCYADITSQIITEGDGVYELTDLDINSTLLANSGYCSNRTNFGGWSIYIVYEDPNLPLNQISLFQGLEIINRDIQEKEIILTNLNVLDTNGAKIGFLAWEGDNALNFGETLSINGNILSNPPLNLMNNAFNGTNTFTNSNTFYNADLDVYGIQDNITIGDTTVDIRLTTGALDINGNLQADLIILNNIITVLNSQLPDATIVIDDYILNCADRTIDIDYTVYNTNSTLALPEGTPIAFYINNILVGQTSTPESIPIGGHITGMISLTVPNNTGDVTELKAVVDDDGTGNGMVSETNEVNNDFVIFIELPPDQDIQILPDISLCNEGFSSANFDLVEHIETNLDADEATVSFFTSLSDLEGNTNEISAPESYNNTSDPQTVYVKVVNLPCFDIYQFNILTENCPPVIPQGFSPNGDGTNDWFNIQGLYDIFTEHELLIYNRYGTLIFEGNNNKPWYGITNRGINNRGKLVPVGTYYYIVNFNDPQYPPKAGWVYVNY